MGALKRLRPWAIDFNTGTHVYQVIDFGPNRAPEGGGGDDIIIKTVNLVSYDGTIRFEAGTDAQARFTEDGMGTGTVHIVMSNSRGTVITTEVLRTGAIRVY